MKCELSAETKSRIAAELVAIEAKIEEMETNIPNDELPPAYDVLLSRRNAAACLLLGAAQAAVRP